MNKLLHCIIILIISTIVVGCEQQVEKKSRIGILLFGDSRQPQVDGFIDGLKKLGYHEGKNTQFIIRNAKNNRKVLPQFVEELAKIGVDLLVAAGGLEADAMKKRTAGKNIPVVVSYVNAIKERKLVIDRRNPGWSVTGVDNLNAELSGKRVELLHDLVPEAKRILVLYYQNIAPSRIGVAHAKETAEKLGLTIDARAVTSREEIKHVMQNLKPGEVDAMLTVPTAPIDNALKEFILPVTDRLKIPLMTHSRPLSEAGALASYGAHFYDLGYQASRLADKILSGVAAEKLPFETPKKFTYTINKRVLDALSIPINDVAKSQINEFIDG